MFSGVLAFGQQPSVSVAIDKQSVILGDSCILTVTVRDANNPETPSVPNIPNFDVRYRGVRQESFSSFTLVVQGQQVQKSQTGGGVNFDFELTPQAAGVFMIPSFSIAVQSETFRTQPFQIEVFDQAQKSEDIFLKIDVDKDNVYLGEKVLVSFSWYFNKDIKDYLVNVPWLENMKSFIVSDPELDQTKRYQHFIVNGNTQVVAEKATEFYRGQQYAVIRFQKILTPLAVGTYTLEPAFLKSEVVQGYSRSNRTNFFDDFFESDFDSFFGLGGFRQAITKPFSTRSEPVTINVREVPLTEQPSSYRGAVGRFDFTVSAKPTHLKVGEPITLTMKVRGSGDIERIELPPLPELPDFKSYEPESRVEAAPKGGKMVGEKTFEKVLVPRREGNFEIPVISFTYFDPDTHNYETISQGPFQVHVEKGDAEDAGVQVIALTPDGTADQTSKQEIKLLKQDIRYVKTDFGNVIKTSKPIYENWMIWLAVLFPPPVLLAFLWFWQSHRERLQTDVGFARNLGALRNAKKHLETAEKLVTSGSPREYYDALSKAIGQYLADKLNRPLAGMTHDVIKDLAVQHLDKGDKQKIRELLDRSEIAVFSSVEISGTTRQEDLKSVKDLLLDFEKVLK